MPEPPRLKEARPLPDPVVTTYLELAEPAALRPSRPPRQSGVAIEQADPPDGALNRALYLDVGRDYAWTDHRDRDAAWWQAHAEAVETWLLTVEGERAGYVELEPAAGGGDVEIAYFGVLPAFHGRGLGGHLLTHALRRGLQIGSRVWVHTCSLDGPHALANYQARGMRPYRREITRHPAGQRE